MLPPQSDDSIRPIVEALQRLDSRLDVRWNPQAVMTKPGEYTVMGKNTDPEYEGRWEVIQWNRASALTDREYVVICRVTQYEMMGAKNPIQVMRKNGAYAPIDQRLVDYLHLCDAANRAAHAAVAVASDQADAAVDAEDLNHERAVNQEASERVWRRDAGEYWMGGAQGNAQPATIETLFGKGKKTIAATN